MCSYEDDFVKPEKVIGLFATMRSGVVGFVPFGCFPSGRMCAGMLVAEGSRNRIR